LTQSQVIFETFLFDMIYNYLTKQRQKKDAGLHLSVLKGGMLTSFNDFFGKHWEKLWPFGVSNHYSYTKVFFQIMNLTALAQISVLHWLL